MNSLFNKLLKEKLITRKQIINFEKTVKGNEKIMCTCSSDGTNVVDTLQRMYPFGSVRVVNDNVFAVIQPDIKIQDNTYDIMSLGSSIASVN